MTGKLRIKHHFDFDSAHYLAGYPGRCANMHGHTYRVEVFLIADGVDELGISVDFGILKSICEVAKHEIDHDVLNETTLFKGVNPTAENMAMILYKYISKAFHEARNQNFPGAQQWDHMKVGVWLEKVRVHEVIGVHWVEYGPYVGKGME